MYQGETETFRCSVQSLQAIRLLNFGLDKEGITSQFEI